MDKLYGRVVAEDDCESKTDPCVKPSFNALPDGVRDFLVDVAGTAMTVLLIASVVAVVLGLIVFVFSSASHRPGVGTIAVKVVAFAIAGVVIGIGASALISYFAGKAVGIFS